VCARCNKISPSDLKFCTRARLGDYSQLFFPGELCIPLTRQYPLYPTELLVSHLEEDRVQRLEFEICSAFVDNSFEVDILCGKGHLPMRLRVAEFIPTNDKVCRFPVISSDVLGQVPEFENKWPLPIALRSVNMSTLVENCRWYVTAMVRQRNHLSEFLPGELNRISHEVLGAVGRYYSSIFPSPQVGI
jgi:hypothetical protein